MLNQDHLIISISVQYNKQDHNSDQLYMVGYQPRIYILIYFINHASHHLVDATTINTKMWDTIPTIHKCLKKTYFLREKNEKCI